MITWIERTLEELAEKYVYIFVIFRTKQNNLNT